MAIAFDALTQTTNGGGVSSQNFNHTITGSAPILFVAVAIDRNGGTGGGDQTVSGITWNSVSLSKIDASNYAQNDTQNTWDRIELWYLKSPATGALSGTVTFTGNTKCCIAAYSYTGVDSTSPIGTVATPTTGASNPSISLTTANNNSWVTSATSTFGDTLTSPSDTSRANIGNGIQLGIQDESVPTGGTSTSESWTATGHGWAMVACEFKVNTANSALANKLLLTHVG